jgi:transcriptional regulator with PAS, ATPase and Fis domain
MEWIEKLNGNVLVSDAKGIIIYMNEAAIKNYAADGGAAMIGRNMNDCHNENSRKKIEEIIATRRNNVYTIEKGGIRKVICQSPVFAGEEFRGIIEFSLEITGELPHFIRD